MCVFVNGDLPSAVWPVCVCTYVFVNGDLPSAVWPVCVCEFVNGDLPSAVWPVCVCYSTGQKKVKVPNGRCGGGAVAVRYLYARGTLEVRSRYAGSTLKVRSRYARSTLEVRLNKAPCPRNALWSHVLRKRLQPRLGLERAEKLPRMAPTN